MTQLPTSLAPLTFLHFNGIVIQPTALVLTILIEWAVYCLVQRKRYLLLAWGSILINCMTQPVAVTVYTALPDWTAWWIFLVIELAIVLLESLLIWRLFRLSYRRALVLSLLANVASGLASILFW